MGREAGADPKKVDKILAVLKKNPKGIWIRELARKSKVSKSTVHRYLHSYLKGKVKVVMNVRGLVKMYKLKR